MYGLRITVYCCFYISRGYYTSRLLKKTNVRVSVFSYLHAGATTYADKPSLCMTHTLQLVSLTRDNYSVQRSYIIFNN